MIRWQIRQRRRLWVFVDPGSSPQVGSPQVSQRTPGSLELLSMFDPTNGRQTIENSGHMEVNPENVDSGVPKMDGL